MIRTTLNGALNATALTCTVNDGTRLPRYITFQILIDNEQISCTRSDNTLTIQRGQQGTDAAAHDDGSDIDLLVNDEFNYNYTEKIEDIIEGIISGATGTSYPTSPTGFTLFYRTDLKRFYLWNGSSFDSVLIETDVDDTAVNGVTTYPVSSNWAYDHANGADPHTGYILHALATATNDFLVASGSGVYVKKTLAETKAILMSGFPLTGWLYRKKLIIDQTDDLGTGTNYQMKLLVGESSGATGEQVDCGSHVASDFDDLRFTSSDESTLLDYWIESISGTTPNQLATVWVEVPMADDAADVTVYMYYGGTETAASSGANTFLWFDDFSTAWNNPVKWTGDTASGSVTGGILTFTGANAAHKVILGNVGGADVAMRCKANIGNGDFVAVGLGESPWNVANIDIIDILHSSGSTNHSAWESYKANTQTIWSNTDAGFGAYHIYDICRYVSGTDTARGAVDGTATADNTTNVPIVDMYVLIRTYNAITVLCDWILLRKFTLNEPTWSSYGFEEAAWTTLFS